MSEGEPPSGTVRSLDRRVERLESQVSDLSVDLRLMQQAQESFRQLIEQHFKTSEKTDELTISKIDLLTSRFDAAMLAGVQASGDPTSTPAGKQIVNRMDAMEREKEQEHAEIDERVSGLERRMYLIVGGLILLGAVAQIAGPYILNHL